VSKSTFLQGALILTAAGVIVKIIGAVNRILLSRLLGGEGIGLYQMAYPIYQLALSISSAGIPVAISILVAEKTALGDFRGANRIFRISFTLLVITGLLFTGLLYFGAGWLVEQHLVRDARAYWAIVALAPAIFFVTILSSYRGYFQGLQEMTPTAVSQIVEQLVRVATMIAFAYFLLPYGLEYAAAGASFGAGPGALFGLFVLICYYWRHRRAFKSRLTAGQTIKQETSMQVVGRIIKLALPVSLANIMIPVVANIDLLIVPARLEVAGYTVEQATELFGYLTGMAAALVNLPTILTASLGASLVPAVSEAFTLRNYHQIKGQTVTALRIANMITIPSCVGLYLLATPISQMLYGTPNAGLSIAILSIGIIFMGIHQVSTGILQGLGHTTIPLANMAISALAKIILSWVLTALPTWGIRGAAWATVTDYGLAAFLNLWFVHRYVGASLQWRDLSKTTTAAAGMGVLVLLIYDNIMTAWLSNTIATLVAITAGILIYGLVLLLLGGIQPRDLERVPLVGNFLLKLLQNFGLMRR